MTDVLRVPRARTPDGKYAPDWIVTREDGQSRRIVHIDPLRDERAELPWWRRLLRP